MRAFLLSALLTTSFALPLQAQDTAPAPEGVWVTLDGIESADLAVRGWSFASSTGLNAGNNGLLVTFWRDTQGNIARCVFSLVSPTGAETFETCSVAATVNRDSE